MDKKKTPVFFTGVFFVQAVEKRQPAAFLTLLVPPSTLDDTGWSQLTLEDLFILVYFGLGF